MSEPRASSGTRPRRRWPAAGCTAAVLLFAAVLVAGYLRSEYVSRRAALLDRVNLQRISLAMLEYAAANDGSAPERLEQLVASRLLAPGDLLRQGSPRGATCGYWYVLGLAADDPPDWPVVLSADPRSGAALIVLLRDGDVQSWSGARAKSAWSRFEFEHHHARGSLPLIIAPALTPPTDLSGH